MEMAWRHRESSACQVFAESRGSEDAMPGSEEIDVIRASLLDNFAHWTPGVVERAKKMGNSGEQRRLPGFPSSNVHLRESAGSGDGHND